MIILVCNVGSTSLKYRVFHMSAGERCLARGGMERVGTPLGAFTREHAGKKETVSLPIPDYEAAIRLMLDALVPDVLASLNEISCVAFKVVHGGPVTGTQLMTEEVLGAMTAFQTLATSHNPPYIAAIRLFAAQLPGIPLIGAFETAFHRTIPQKAYRYSLPKALYTERGIRRYGFHGASHEYVTGRVMALTDGAAHRLITCHLGGSGSLCAVMDGQSVDTNLGFSLQSGIMHNNRCGDIDPYLPLYLMKDLGYTMEQVETLLNKESGFLGMSGVSNDMRDLELAAVEGNEDAALTIESYCYAIKKQIGAYVAALGGLDAIAFAGGIGEKSALVRRESLKGLACMGISLDEKKNATCVPDCELSDGTGSVKIYVIATNEELIVARKAAAYLQNVL
jgi:acetate kinase